LDFCDYNGIELIAVYRVEATDLEVFFSKWETKWHLDGGKDINNPKIPLKHVMTVGQQIYPA
jgi:hypothetical protein